MSSHDKRTYQQRVFVEHTLPAHHIYDPNIRRAMMAVPRHYFVPKSCRPYSYTDKQIDIGFQQVMLSPIVVARLLHVLSLSGVERILEIGVGTGYMTALLTQLGFYVYSLENILPLADAAASRLHRLGFNNVDIHVGDGSQGLLDMAPFDVIIATASVPRIPRPLMMQLHPLRGRAIIPVGGSGIDKTQMMKFIRRNVDRWHVRSVMPVNVPVLVGRYGATPSAQA